MNWKLLKIWGNTKYQATPLGNIFIQLQYNTGLSLCIRLDHLSAGILYTLTVYRHEKSSPSSLPGRQPRSAIISFTGNRR